MIVEQIRIIRLIVEGFLSLWIVFCGFQIHILCLLMKFDINHEHSCRCLNKAHKILSL